MYFIIKPNSEVHCQLSELWKRILEIREQCWSLTEELGATGYALDHLTLAGPIAAFQFQERPAGWKLVKKPDCYFPGKSKANQPLLDKIAAIPKVSAFDLNRIVNFKDQRVGNKWIFRVGMTQIGEDFLMSVKEYAEYTPIAGVEEITGTEYKRRIAEDELELV